MSSSDKLPDWSVFQERWVPFPVELLSPAAEMATLLQLHRQALDQARQEVAAIQDHWLQILAQQAVLIYHLESALKRYEDQLQ